MTVGELRGLLDEYDPDAEVRVFWHEFSEALHVQEVGKRWMRTKYPFQDNIRHDGAKFPRVTHQKQVIVIF